MNVVYSVFYMMEGCKGIKHVLVSYFMSKGFSFEIFFFFFSSRRRHTRYWRDWSSDVCSSDLPGRARPDPHRRRVHPRRRAWGGANRAARRVGLVRRIGRAVLGGGEARAAGRGDRKSVV